jgi:hypothetical protein
MQPDQSDYEIQSQANRAVFWSLVQKTMPDFYVLLKEIEDSEVDTFLLTKIARALGLLARGTKYGKVVITVENGIATFVYGEEANRVNLPVLKPSELDKMKE